MSKYGEMLKFNEEEYRKSAELIKEARPYAEKAADELSARGYKNIFFTAVGGSLAPMMAMGEIALIRISGWHFRRKMGISPSSM